MASIVLIGADAALLEGLSQTLAAAGHQSSIALTLGEGMEHALIEPPLIAVIERALVSDALEALHMPLAPGGALVLFHANDVVTAHAPLPRAVHRLTLAELALPLERQRLVAIVGSVESRARNAGRSRTTPSSGHERAL